MSEQKNMEQQSDTLCNTDFYRAMSATLDLSKESGSCIKN